MVVAFDIDGTITRSPALFAFLSQALVAGGHRVLIITFREGREVTTADLAAWGIVYDELITSTLEGCLEHGVDEWKGAICRRVGVDVLFDDDPDVLRHISPKTLCFMAVDADRGNLPPHGEGFHEGHEEAGAGPPLPNTEARAGPRKRL